MRPQGTLNAEPAEFAEKISFLCYNRMPTPSFTYTARPPTIVAATPPPSVQPSNGVFFDSERIAAAEEVTERAGARIEMSAGAPSASEPPGRLSTRAGFTDSSSTRRD